MLERVLERDRLYVMDRGYAKFALFNVIAKVTPHQSRGKTGGGSSGVDSDGFLRIMTNTNSEGGGDRALGVRVTSCCAEITAVTLGHGKRLA